MIYSDSIVNSCNDFMIYKINMLEVLIAMLSWIAINVITWLSGKLGLSKTYVSVCLCLVIGVILYCGQLLIDKYPLAWKEIVAFATGAYWFSQIVWNLYQKYIEKKESKKE